MSGGAVGATKPDTTWKYLRAIPTLDRSVRTILGMTTAIISDFDIPKAVLKITKA